MGETDIIRPITESERQEVVEVGKANIMDLFLSNLATKQQEFQRKYKPFDSYSARIDFDDKIRKVIGDTNLAVDKNKVNKKLDIGNLNKYGDADRFEFISVEDVREDKLLDGIRNTVVTGKKYSYRGKERGNGITIFVPSSEVASVEAYVDKTYTKQK